MKINYKYLKGRGACRDRLKWYRRIFGNDDVDLNAVLNHKEILITDIWWLYANNIDCDTTGKYFETIATAMRRNYKIATYYITTSGDYRKPYVNYNLFII